jgi:intracellular sulfur oxidation DsrE/DsrF family protein
VAGVYLVYRIITKQTGVLNMRMKWLQAVTVALSGALLGGLAGSAVAADASARAKERVVIQVSDDSPKTWGQALNVVENLQQAYGKDNVEIKLVALGFGIGILTLDSVAGSRVQDALQSGAQITACEVTMRRRKLTRDDMLPHISYVPAGVVEIIKLQKEGWSHLRP